MSRRTEGPRRRADGGVTENLRSEGATAWATGATAIAELWAMTETETETETVRGADSATEATDGGSLRGWTAPTTTVAVAAAHGSRVSPWAPDPVSLAVVCQAASGIVAMTRRAISDEMAMPLGSTRARCPSGWRRLTTLAMAPWKVAATGGASRTLSSRRTTRPRSRRRCSTSTRSKRGRPR